MVRAVHDDVVVVTRHADLPAVLKSAAAAGAAVDAELAPAQCAGWSPAGAAAPAHWPALWHAEGVTQFPLPLGTDAFVAAAVDRPAATHGALTDAIVALPPAELQAQLLLLRLCAGPQPNYWLRALPLVWGGRLAGAVDRAAQGALRRLLTDARDPPPDVHALLARAALPLSQGGLGIGGRAAVVPAAALASRIDSLRAGRQYSPTLAAVADFLLGSDAGPAGTAPPPSLPSYSTDVLALAPGRHVARRPPPSARQPADLAAGPPALAASSSPVLGAAGPSVAGARPGASHLPPLGPPAASHSLISGIPAGQSRPPGCAARFSPPPVDFLLTSPSPPPSSTAPPPLVRASLLSAPARPVGPCPPPPCAVSGALSPPHCSSPGSAQQHHLLCPSGGVRLRRTALLSWYLSMLRDAPAR